MKISRKNFLKLTGAVAAGATLGQVGRIIPGGMSPMDEAFQQPPDRDRIDEWLAGRCTLCPASCPARIRFVNGALAGIRPDTERKGACGTLCLKAFALIQDRVHPQRIVQPMAGKGKNAKPVDWDTALKSLSAFLGKGKGAGIVLNSESNLTNALYRRAARLMGAKLYVPAWEFGEAPLDALSAAGGYGIADYDFENAKNIMSFGAEWLMTSTNPAQAYYGFGRVRGARRRGRITTVSPRYGLTCLKSDEWVPCSVGGEGAAALGVASILSERGWIKLRAGVKVAGLDKLRAKLRSSWSAERMAKASGVPMETLRKLALHLHEDSTTMVMGPRGGLADQWAVLLLSALSGSLGAVGGLRPRGPVTWERMVPGAERGGSLEAGSEALLADIQSKKIKRLLVLESNPAFISPDPQRWEKALGSLESVIAVGRYRDETSAHAETFLPAAMAMEREDWWATPCEGVVEVERTRTLIAARGEARSPASILLAAAVHSPLRGKIGYKDEKQLLSKAKGAARAWKNPGGNYHRKIDLNFSKMPSVDWQKKHFAGEGMNLIPISVPAYTYGYGGHLPYLISTTAPLHRFWWRTMVEINPEDAHEKRIKDGDEVWVKSAGGRIKVVAKLYPGLPRGSVAMPFGQGRNAGGLLKRGSEQSINPAVFVTPNLEKGSAVPRWNMQRVEISKVGVSHA